MLHDDRWPGCPRLLPGESLSSWFARTAAANGLRPAELFRIVQPGGDRTPRDLDRHADDPLLYLLADRTGVARDALVQATFRHWAGTVFAHDDGLNKLPWLPPAGRVGGRRCFGQQFCPWCLHADAVPYLRLNWRLSFVTVCPIHQRLLLDRCPACNEPFSVLRMDRVQDMRCPSCAADLRHVTADTPPVDVVPVQQDLQRVVGQGWWALGAHGPVYSFAALDILDVLLRLLAGGPHAHALRAWIGEREPALAVPPEAVPRARDGALLTPRARSVVIAMAHWLMGEWPKRLIEGAHAVGMTSTDLWKRPKEYYPFAFADVVEWHLKAPHKGSNQDEVVTAKAILMRQGKPATHRNLVALCGIKLGAMSDLADAASENAAPWGKGRYWKLGGVSPEVKEAARRAAHRAGEGVGPWLTAYCGGNWACLPTKHLTRAKVPTHSPMNLFPVVQVRGNCAMPVRRIGLCYRSVSGRVPMCGGRRTVAVESTLERDFALLQRFDHDVVGLEEQPVRISYRDHGGAKRSYVPDFLVTYRQGAPKLVEVKFSNDPALLAGVLGSRFAAARTFAADRGWRFSVVTEIHIRTPRLGNATFLLPFRDRTAIPALKATILMALRSRELSVEGLLDMFSIDRASVLPTLWGMVARLELHADLDHPLTMRSQLSLPEVDHGRAV